MAKFILQIFTADGKDGGERLANKNFYKKYFKFQNDYNKVVIVLLVAQFWSEIKLVTTNSCTPDSRRSNFAVTHLISDQIALLSAQLPLLIYK